MMDLLYPHGMRCIEDGYYVVDTGNARIVFLDEKFRISGVVEFSGWSARYCGEYSEWLQETHLCYDRELFITVDSLRQVVYVWSLKDEVFSRYRIPHDQLVQAVIPA